MGPASALVSTHKFPPALRPRQEMPADKDEFVASVSTLDTYDTRAVNTGDTQPLTTGGVRLTLGGGVTGATSRWGKLRLQQQAGVLTGRRPSLQTLARGVTQAHRNPTNRSRACVVQ